MDKQYTVIENEDVKPALSAERKQQLKIILDVLEDYRTFTRKPKVKYLVIEETSPIFLDVVKLITERFQDD
jgi:hypothetical protein